MRYGRGFMHGLATVARGLVTMILLASWNITTTHCAFAAAIRPASPAIEHPAADECPMHATKMPAPEPQKKKGCPDLPCCKMLPARVAAKVVGIGKWPKTLARVDYICRTPCRFELVSVRKQLSALDTGPPRPNKVTEVIFQRSIPAHAPPTAS
jgi:hypothetical protein